MHVRESAPHQPRLVAAAAGLLLAGGVLFVAEVLLSTERYFTGMRVYERAASNGVIKNDEAFAAVGVALHLVPAAVGVVIGAVGAGVAKLVRHAGRRTHELGRAAVADRPGLPNRAGRRQLLPSPATGLKRGSA
jgi:hypothetical protein